MDKLPLVQVRQGDRCCVSVQGLHPLWAAFVGMSNKGGRQMEPSFPEFEGYTRWILHGPVCPKMQCGLAFGLYEMMK